MENANEVKQIAAQLLSGLLANPHIYPYISDEGVQGQQKQELIVVTIGLAESLIDKIYQKAN